MDFIKNLKYSDVTKVMVQTLLEPGETEGMATERLLEFLKFFYPEFINLID